MTFSEMLTVAPGAGTELLSLPCADGDSDTAEPVLTRGPGQPTFWNQTNNDLGAPPTVLNITIPAQCEENTMRVIGLRRGPTRTEGSVPTGAATAIPRFTQGLQGSVCGNAFPLLTLQKRAISKCWGALAPNPHQAPSPRGLEEIPRVTSAWRCVRLSSSSYTEQGRGLFLSTTPLFHKTQQLCLSRQSGVGAAQASSGRPEGRMQVGQHLVLPLRGHISLHQSINSFHSQPSLWRSYALLS